MENRAAQPTDFSLAGRFTNAWQYIAKTGEGETIEAVSDPAFWCHVKRARALDTIEVLADNGKWEVHFRIVALVPGGLKVRELRRYEAPDDENEIAAPPMASVNWGGPHHKWRIVTDKGDVYKTGFGTEAEAQSWLSKRALGIAEAA